MKAKGARRPEDRFARAVEAEMNRMASEGWEFVRSDTLPCEQRSGWFSRPATVFQTLLVFRRPLGEAGVQAPRAAMPPPVTLAPAASVTTPPPAAPAASRFTPLPTSPNAANVPAPAVPLPPAPTLTLVGDRGVPAEPPLPRHPFLDDLSQALGESLSRPDSESRRAVE
ncbi:hypothetical protein Rumeso_01267 [Rubellimicrobium mesophilum DSM 19309]|uniref:DUF4177 domain-containing protein n=1 Tax=Rubellimicrobium mesophilum DSM 19309 TaxID=442562 RepID=A0A017HS54_9RHOB|nr:hypothetical protein Rumeso_01267 [Rubellimicrobium mesophilum DSM 19309]